MKIHTTNYSNTFIEVAEDCPAGKGSVPSPRGNKPTVAKMQFNLIRDNPYRFTSDDVLFQVFADRNDLTPAEYASARTDFFSKGQACFRASPLTKRYGWGVHFNEDQKMALYAIESEEYAKLINDPGIAKVKAMRSSRK